MKINISAKKLSLDQRKYRKDREKGNKHNQPTSGIKKRRNEEESSSQTLAIADLP